MNSRSHKANFAIGVALLVFLQPWLLIGVMLGYEWGHYGPSPAKIVFLMGWATVFLSCLWVVFVKFRQALRQSGGVAGRILVWAAILAGMMMAGVVCYPLFGMPVGARWIPAQEPTDDRRVVHPLGFSIVSPPGWKARIWNFPDDAGISLYPGYKGRHGPGLGITASALPPDLLHYQEIPFLDLKAYERTVTGTGENARLRYELVVTHSNQWYRVMYSESRAFESDPSLEFPEIMKRYVHSFWPSQTVTNPPVQ
jgi:hypothetical protein